MFVYFFDINGEAFSRFAREVLHIEVQTDFTIEREKRNIDLLISDKNNAVVIENKRVCQEFCVNRFNKQHRIAA